MDSEDAGWPEFLYTNGDIDSHMDLCRRIVRRAAEWLSHDKWSSPEGGALAQVKRTANGWRVEGMLNACCHRIAYSWDLDRLPADSELSLLVENAEARSRDCLSQDVREGELVASVSYPDADDAPEEEVEVFGWWSIAR